MFKLKCDDFLIYDETTGTYSMAPEQQVGTKLTGEQMEEHGLRNSEDWRLYAMLIPMVLVYFLRKYMPMYELIGCFKRSEHGRFAARRYLFVDGCKDSSRTLHRGLKAISYGGVPETLSSPRFYGLLFGFPMPIILALFFNEVARISPRSVMQVCVYLPKFLSTVIVTSLVYGCFLGPETTNGQSAGLLSKLFGVFGASDDAVKRRSYLHYKILPCDIYHIRSVGARRLRQYSILCGGNRRFADFLRGGADERQRG